MRVDNRSPCLLHTQSGPNITISAVDHGLEQNQRVKITFTSGSALSGDYVVSSVTNSNTFVIVCLSDTASGYCDVSNLQPHEYVGTGSSSRVINLWVKV